MQRVAIKGRSRPSAHHKNLGCNGKLIAGALTSRSLYHQFQSGGNPQSLELLFASRSVSGCNSDVRADTEPQFAESCTRKAAETRPWNSEFRGTAGVTRESRQAAIWFGFQGSVPQRDSGVCLSRRSWHCL